VYLSVLIVVEKVSFLLKKKSPVILFNYAGFHSLTRHILLTNPKKCLKLPS